MAVHVKGEGELGTELRLHAQQLQHMGVCGGLVGALLRQAALLGVAEGPVGVVGVGVANLHMGLVEGDLCGHPEKTPDAPLADQRVVPQLFKLLLRQVLEPTVGEAPHLAEVALLEALVDGQGDGEQRGEQHRRQGDGRDGDEIPGAAGL